jgi:hypothetical protein
VKMMKGPVAPVCESVRTEWARAMNDAAAIIGALGC